MQGRSLLVYGRKHWFFTTGQASRPAYGAKGNKLTTGIEPSKSRQIPFPFTKNLNTEYIVKYAKKLWEECTQPMSKGNMKLNNVSPPSVSCGNQLNSRSRYHSQAWKGWKKVNAVLNRSSARDHLRQQLHQNPSNEPDLNHLPPRFFHLPLLSHLSLSIHPWGPRLRNQDYQHYIPVNVNRD